MVEPADLNAAIIAVARRHRHRAGELLGELGLHPGQELILMRLFEKDGRSQADLADSIGIAPPTVNRSLASLERAGLVCRAPSPRDRRATMVELTDTGRALGPAVGEAWAKLEEETAGDLSEGDRRHLLSLLHRVAGHLRAERGSWCP